MDFGGNINLKQFIDKRISEKKPLKISESMHIFKQILLGVTYIHNNEIAHLDIKPDNVTINEKTLSIK